MTTKNQLNIRVPPDLKALLAARADANSRTINGEILAILKDAREDEKTKSASKSK